MNTADVKRSMHESHPFLPIILRDFNLVWEKALHLGNALSFPAKALISGSASSFEDPKQGMYYIKKGLVKLSSLSPDGLERTMLFMGPGVFFHEIPMLLTRGDSLFTCMQATDTVFFPKKLLGVDFIRDYPELIFNLIESMGRKSHSFYSQLSLGWLLSSFNNTCRALYSMHLFNTQNGRVVPGLTQLELAAFLGIHRSSLHKFLVRLKDEGIIGPYTKKELAIYRPELLHRYTLETNANDAKHPA